MSIVLLACLAGTGRSARHETTLELLGRSASGDAFAAALLASIPDVVRRPVSRAKLLAAHKGAWEQVSLPKHAPARLLQLNITADELARRGQAWTPPPPRYRRGVLAKYAALVSSSSLGAVTDLDLPD